MLFQLNALLFRVQISNISFDLLQHTTKPVPMMFLSGKFNFTYIESVQTDVVELPYINNDLSMFILLPRDIAGLQKVRGRELK